jgi:hypothetical protein
LPNWEKELRIEPRLAATARSSAPNSSAAALKFVSTPKNALPAVGSLTSSPESLGQLVLLQLTGWNGFPFLVASAAAVALVKRVEVLRQRLVVQPDPLVRSVLFR